MTDEAFAAKVAKIKDPYKLLRIIADNMGECVDGYYHTLTSAMIDQAEKLASEHEKGLKLPPPKKNSEAINPTLKCETCKTRKAKPIHTCPYSSEINNDDTECNCCDKCKADCEMAI